MSFNNHYLVKLFITDILWSNFIENLCIEIKATNKAIKRSEGKNIVTLVLIRIVHYLFVYVFLQSQ